MPPETNGLVQVACPGCQGLLETREGERIIKCPYCDLLSTIIGDEGILRYQVKRRIDASQAHEILHSFLRRFNRVFDLDKEAKIMETTIAYVPFWSTRARVASWQFGFTQDAERGTVRPIESEFLTEFSWSEAACDLNEFGLHSLGLGNHVLELFDPEELHKGGMVFEPTGSAEAHRQRTLEVFSDEIKKKSMIRNVENVELKLFNEKVSLVYYPLWIVRYKYRDRLFQVVIAGESGKVLSGRAPGNIMLGAITLVVGMAIAAFMFVALPSYSLTSFTFFSLNAVLMFTFPIVAVALIVVSLKWFHLGGVIEFQRSSRKIEEVVRGRREWT